MKKRNWYISNRYDANKHNGMGAGKNGSRNDSF